MNVAIVGYGKMGHQIEKVLLEKGITPKTKIDKFVKDVSFNSVDSKSLSNIDVVIDFASPDDIIERVKEYVENGVSVVMGTTGWFDKIDQIKSIVDGKIGFIWSGNFSIGVNVFFRLVKLSSAIFDKLPDYDKLVYEIHHKEKKDSPSGTAIMIGNMILDASSTKNSIITSELNRKIGDNELHVASVRGGYYPGTHSVQFDSFVDTIELKHTARNREGFAYGAVLACNWIYGKKGFFNIDDLMNSIF